VPLAAETATGLDPNTTYEFRLGVRFSWERSDRYVDSRGTEGGTSYDGFTTTAASASCTRTLAVGTDVASAVATAANGAVICLTSGNHGTVDLRDVGRTGFVTVRQASGAAATISPSVGSSRFIRFSGLTIAGAQVTGCSTHIHFVAGTFTRGLLITNNGSACPVGNQDYLVEGSTFDGVGQATYEGRLNLVATDGAVIRNSRFSGIGSQASDGIQLLGGARNSTIAGNRFTGIEESRCGSVHCDALQLYGAGANNVIDGNQFDHGDTFIMAPDGSSSAVVTDNVFDGSGVGYVDKVQFGSASGARFEHNTLRDVRVSFDSKTGSPASSGVLARNNVMDGSSFKTSNGNGCAACTFTRNLFSTGGLASGSSNVTGRPAFVGGAAPSTYAGWALAVGSPGKGAATDGTDMGIVP
jgi:hypothetical protein